MFLKNFALIIIRSQLSLCSFPLLWLSGVQTSRAKCPVSCLTTTDSQALLEGLALSDSSWSLLVRAVKPDQSHFLWMCVFVYTYEGERVWEQEGGVVYCVYLCVHLCLQQLSAIISLYHVMSHVGIFPAVPERLFCFLRLASARRNAAY